MNRDRRPQLRDLEVEIPHGVRPNGLDSGTVPRHRCPCAVPTAEKPSTNCGRFWTLPVRSGEGARKSDPVQGSATHSEKRWAFRIARMGRELSCNRRLGRAFGFPDQDTREDRAGPQNCAALLRKARPGGNDLRAPRSGNGQDVAELNPSAPFPEEQVVKVPS